MKLVKVITCGWEEGRSSVNASIETFQCIHFCVWIFEVYERIALKKKRCEIDPIGLDDQLFVETRGRRRS